MDLELILPVYNEFENLGPLLTEIDEVLEPTGISHRIIYVDDGSTDGSTEKIKTICDSNSSISSIHFDSNCGQSAAFAAGFNAAEAPLLVTMDADGQNDPADIPAMLDSIGKYDVVAGYRQNRKDNAIKKIGSNIANSVRNYVTNDNIIDTGCSLKVFKNEVVKAIPMFQGMHRFLPTLAKMEGFNVTQVPTNHRPRERGETKYGISDRLSRTVWDLLAVRWMQNRHIDYTISDTHNLGDFTDLS